MNAKGLYLIMTNPVIGYQKLTEIAVNCKISIIQLRIKDHEVNKINLATDLRNITNRTNTKFIINDDINLAMESDADGIHLGQNDLSITKAKDLWKNKNKIFGISTHNQHQAMQAEKNGADYIGIGPIFSTLSKKNLDPILGIEKASHINNSCNCPSFIIGGIRLNNIKQVKNIGSKGFCVLNSINISKNPEKIIKLLQEEWESIDF
tara:strand:- start:103 stop:723 length:621 start_codon:yes stop_codon:yes gene_type:complete